MNGLNKQNHRLFGYIKGTLPESTIRISMTQKPASVMVWAGVTASGRTQFAFIHEGVKVNQLVYIDTILEEIL